MGKRAAFVLALLLGLPLAAQADVAKGIWQTEADDKGQVGHVSVTSCGAVLCGTITKASDAQMREVITKNVGRQILFDMTETKAGLYAGRVLIPKFNRTLKGTMKVTGHRMYLSGCLSGVCGNQTWTRVR